MKAARPLFGLVLAGGRSRRMGRDKAALIHPDGRPLAQRALELLADAGCARVFLSVRHDQELPPGISLSDKVSILRDPIEGSVGPLAGILTALRSEPAADWLVLACDLPRLDGHTLSHLCASRRDGERFLSYRSEWDGLPEPLCALYAAEALPVLESARDAGIRCPRAVLLQQECRLLDPLVVGALDNANTPEEWTTACAT